jgi:hypothetical protein
VPKPLNENIDGLVPESTASAATADMDIDIKAMTGSLHPRMIMAPALL